MPVVPITKARGQKMAPTLPMRPPPSEPFALMAAAAMHQEGRLVKTPQAPITMHENLSKEEQDDWERSWEKAVEDSPAARRAVPEGYEGMVYPNQRSKTTPGLLFMRPLRTTEEGPPVG